MASILAKNTSGSTLSQGGALTTPLFGQHGYVGDVQGVDIVIDTAGQYRSGNYRIAGIPHVQMSLDNVTYGAEGAALNVPGPITDTATRIYLKISSTASPAGSLALDQTGIIAASASGGTVPVTVTAAQTITANFAASGTCACTCTPSCNPTVPALGNVTGFSVTSISGTTVNLGWSAVASADHYKITWGTDGVTYGNTIDSVTGTSYAHTGRTANTTYYYRIYAHNASHGAESATPATAYAAVKLNVTVAHAIELRAYHASSFSTARSGSGTNSVNGTDAYTELSLLNQESGGFYIERVYLDFDTSAIGSGATIDEAYLRITGTYTSWPSSGFTICKGTWSGASGAVVGDWSALTIGTDLGGPTANLTLNTPTDYAVSLSNTAVIKAGTTRLAVIERAKDFGNTAPGTGGQSGNNIGAKANATTNYRPQLLVSYHG